MGYDPAIYGSCKICWNVSNESSFTSVDLNSSPSQPTGRRKLPHPVPILKISEFQTYDKPDSRISKLFGQIFLLRFLRSREASWSTDFFQRKSQQLDFQRNTWRDQWDSRSDGVGLCIVAIVCRKYQSDIPSLRDGQTFSGISHLQWFGLLLAFMSVENALLWPDGG